MRKFATLVTTLALAMSGLVFSPVHAAVPANGDYVCSTGLIKTTETTNLYTITAGVVSWHSGGFCSGAVIIPAGVTGILEEAFEDDALLTSISIPASVSIIGSYAFSGTTALTSITVHADNANYRSIDGVLFNKAITTLISYPARKFGTSYSIPESVASIDGYAFLSAAALTNITIPASVSSIGIGALSGMAALTSITVHADNANYRSTNGVLFNKASTTLIIYPARKIGTSYSIPASVTSIGGFAFLSAAALTSITIPASVANIGDYVFSGATALRSFYFLGNAPTVTVNSQFTAPGSGATAHVTSVATGFENNVLETWNGLSVEILGDGDYVCSTGFMKTTETTNLFKITASVASAHSSGPCSGSVVIPIDVTSIGDSAFANATGLTSITIPASVSSIGDYAFVNATGLTSITIPASVTSIGTGAFRGATALTSITIPASVTSIGTSAFLDAIALSGVNFLGDEPATVGTSPFSNVAVGARAHIKATATGFGVAGADWNGLKVEILAPDGNYVCAAGVLATTETTNLYTITDGVVGPHSSGSCVGAVLIPAGATSISQMAFTDAVLLTSITIPASVSSIEEYAFWNAPLLTSITVHADNLNFKTLESVLFNKTAKTLVSYPAGKSGTTYLLPSSVTSIGEGAFAYAAALTSISIPEGVTGIGSYAFSDATSLASITIPATATSIGFAAFYNATSLASITIPEGVLSIGGYAFSNVTALTSITIPASVTSIGEYAFWKMTSLASITVHDYNTNYLDTDGVLFNKLSTTLVSYPAGKSGTSYPIPEGVTSIGVGAFAQAATLTSVTIPQGIISIEEYAFSDATSLTSITIPASVTSIGVRAFAYASALTSFYFVGTAPTNLGTNPFLNVAVGAKAYIKYGDSSFGVAGADWNGLEVEILAQDGTYVCSTGLIKTTETTNLYTITTGVVDAHSSGKCAGAAVIRSGVTTIGDYAFSDATALSSITIPEGVTHIGKVAFSGATLLSSITIPSGVTRIESFAFFGATALTSVTLPSSVTYIGNSAFADTTALTSITLPSGIKNIGPYLFEGTTSLTSITIPSSVTEINQYVFKDATALTSITIPSSVSLIGEFAFDGATRLTSIYFLGNAPTTVGTTPFLNVASGAKAYIRSGDSSFGGAGADWNGLTVAVVVDAPAPEPGAGAPAPVSVAAPVQAPAAVTSTQAISAKKKYSAISLAKKLGVKIVSSKATVSIKAGKSSKKVCTKSGSMLKTLKSGKCVVTFTVQEPKSKKGKKPKATKTIMTFVVQ